ncbi:MAG: hypothetical protein WBO95_02060 [Candidatus Dechloromonas phosphoritropha]|jgi:hypothetical protein
MTQKFTRWDLVDHLKSDEDMALYLDACLDEDPGDGMLVRAAFNDIARAQGMTDREWISAALGRLARLLAVDRKNVVKKGNDSGSLIQY